MWWIESSRTDLAVERATMVQQREGQIPGIQSSEQDLDGIKITRVQVLTPQAAAKVGKPPGRYFTLECPQLRYRNRALLKKVADVISKELSELASLPRKGDVLVVGLGNWQATPDALGPRVVAQLMVTRHIRDYVPQELGGRLYPVAAVSPGVLGITGIETIDIVRGIVNQIKPELVITVDALAARSPSRLLTTVQIADTGIQPGSGVGNKRPGINQETLGIPVVAIGVPTVISGASIAADVLDAYFSKFNPHARATLDSVQDFLGPDLFELMVTTKDIDVQIHEMSKLLASAINHASQPAITEEEMLDYLQ
ncbi:MAG: GPR endopeptidase [Candidatus Fermentithermobacillus carboniphilus]|uniref:GPR endopeptidase n=1 Tax=Candidatus Fermentithermobacillus carboniphilus TaxID=3085328 RepID=A0AAT9LC86_9FIRM|nr:MAG: GPR endopeptidase [Candidatus Fermentithermobacillus carboniphilus]